ncbi:MAG: heavy-metal-associated domain-containing protein [Bacteroidia bacterium]|nr:heavy-metal-associated domain-containing protein [Bacteroidia bacterium]
MTITHKMQMTKYFLILILTTVVSINVNAKSPTNNLATINKVTHEVTDSFEVSGNCGMCKKTIESSLSGLEGISYVNWDIDSKIMIVTYDPHALTLTSIKQKIADSGYDTDTIKAKEENYEGLPRCCQYDRK